MKKAIKNYLAKLQENDKKGFSLVELIIVMAIMAILVGIVASQVLPYMEKSRQAKDQQLLSSLVTDMVSAIAQADKAVESVTACELKDATAAGGDWITVLNQLRSPDGDTATTLSAIEDDIVGQFKSKKATDPTNGKKVYVSYDKDTGEVCVWTGAATYAAAPDKLKVSSKNS